MSGGWFCRTAIVAAVGFATVECSAATTPGWENVNHGRREFPRAALVWGADLDKLRVEKLDGAEGEMTVEGDRLRVRKTNERGCLRIVAPTIALSVGTEWRFSVDVADVTTRSFDEANGRLSVSTNGVFFPEIDEFHHDWFEAGGDRMFRLLNTPPGMSYRKFTHGTAVYGELTPAILVYGAASESVWSGWAAEELDAAQALWTQHREQKRVSDRADEMQPLAAFERSLREDIDHIAEVRTVAGRSVFFVDGEPRPQMVYKQSHMFYPPPSFNTYAGKPLQKAGVRIGVIEVDFGGNPEKIRCFWTKDGFDAKGAVGRIRDAMRVGDESVFLLAIGLNAYPEFTQEHPDETWRNRDGTPVCGDFGSATSDYSADGDLSSDRKTWPWVSYSSESYRTAVKRNLSRLLDELKRTGLSKRIIGFHLVGYHDGQFAMPFPDYSDCAKAEYLRYLAEGHEDREFEFFSVQTGFRTQEDFARHLKREIGKPVVATRWCMMPFGSKPGAFDITAFIRSDAIDIIVPQTRYLQRSPGFATGTVIPIASLHDSRKLLWQEFDHRNYSAYDTWAQSVVAQKGLAGADDDVEWIDIDRKHHGFSIAQGMGAWYYDMGGGWLREPGIVQNAREIYRVREELCRKSADPWRPDLVWIVDERSLCLYNHDQPPVDCAYRIVWWSCAAAASSGVPYEIRVIDDFIRRPELLRRYKGAVLGGFLYPDRTRRKLMDDLAAAGVRLFLTPERGFTAQELNEFARSVGAFVASEPGLEVDMSGDFLSLHALLPGHHRVKLPFPARVVNLKDGSGQPVAGQGIDVEMTAGETCWFRLYRE